MKEVALHQPDNTAVRTALWRALHLQVDAPPYVFEDHVGLKLAAPADGWQSRPDMSVFTMPFRAAILARARFVEDLLEEQIALGVDQYVLLGAGLDSFAQRRVDLASGVHVYELDRPESQHWKRERLLATGYGVADHLTLVPVDFESGDDWLKQLLASGFDRNRAAVVASLGVSMYLTNDAVMTLLRQIAAFASGTTLVMSFLCPLDMLDADVRVGVERAAEGALASGTPWLSFFRPDDIVALALEAGFEKVQHVSSAALAERYFANRTDNLRPPNHSEELLVATIK